MATTYEKGRDYGAECGWEVIDGNTTVEECLRIVEGYGDGDHEIMDLAMSPLSGEWSGESITEIGDSYGIDLSDGDVAERFESGFYGGFWDEVLKIAKYQMSKR